MHSAVTHLVIPCDHPPTLTERPLMTTPEKDRTPPVALAAVNLADKFARFEEHWSPKIIAETNGWEIKLVKAKGGFIWHHHDIDEVFCVFSGHLTIHLANQQDIQLHPGEIFVVPKGVEHRPEAEQECQLLLLEPAGEINTGQSTSALTAVDEWI